MIFSKTSTKNTFYINLEEPIHLNGRYEIALINGAMWSSWFNITNKNNSFKYYDGSKWITTIIIPGAYSITQINDFLDIKDIQIKPNNSTLGTTIELSNRHQVDFTIDNSPRKILGFESKIVLGNKKFHYSDHLADITDIQMVYLLCDLVEQSYLDGRKSTILFAFVPNTAPGASITFNIPERIYLPIKDTGSITSLNFKLIDQNKNLLELNDQPVSVLVHIRKISQI